LLRAAAWAVLRFAQAYFAARRGLGGLALGAGLFCLFCGVEGLREATRCVAADSFRRACAERWSFRGYWGAGDWASAVAVWRGRIRD
jgi:hypothetical protein